jgi:hypothetical protein
MYFRCFRNALLASVYFFTSYARKPHALALKKTGIRIVAASDDDQQEDSWPDEAYRALVLLERYDNEMFHQVIKYIRIIVLFSTDSNVSHVPTGRLYFLYVQAFPITFPNEKLPIIIAGNLAYQATLAKCKGGIIYFDKIKGAAVKEQCRKEQHRTIQKLEEAICE